MDTSIITDVNKYSKPLLIVLSSNKDWNVEFAFSIEPYAGAGYGDFDEDLLGDIWESDKKWNLDPESAKTPNGTYHNPDNDLIPSAATTYGSAWPLTGSRLLQGYNTGAKFNNYLEFAGFDTIWMTNYSGVPRGDDPRTDPHNVDSDDDDMPDGWEYYFWRWRGAGAVSSITGGGTNVTGNAFDPAVGGDPSGDADGDGLSNVDEFDNGTDPTHCDTDRDGLDDWWEVKYKPVLNPLDPADYNKNPDDDLMAYDGTRYHLNVYAMTAPTLEAGDTSFDPRTAWGGTGSDHPNTVAYNSIDEYQGGDRIARIIWNADGINNYTAPVPSDDTSPATWDTDGDAIPDGWEFYVGLNPNDIGDAGSDGDGDGLSNGSEWANTRDSHGNGGNGWSTKLWPTDPGVFSRFFAWQNVWYDTSGNRVYDTNTDVRIWNGGWNIVNDAAAWQITNGVAGKANPKAPAVVSPLPDFPIVYDLANDSAWADTDGDNIYTAGIDIPSTLKPPSNGDAGSAANLFFYHNDYHPTDTDWDGLTDSTTTGGGEFGAGSNPTTVDSDNDFLPDGWERYAHSDILVADQIADPDNDGLPNNLEYWTGVVPEWMHLDVFWPDYPGRMLTRRPMRWDLGNGGSGSQIRSDIPYYLEPDFVTCPSFNVAVGQKAETANGYAFYHTTRVDDPDTDFDGMDDYWEVYHGLNPLKGSRDFMADPIPFSGGDRQNGTGNDADAWDADPVTTPDYFEIGTAGTPFTSVQALIVSLINPLEGYSAQVGPFNFGLELMDPDGDGLPNIEEYSYESGGFGRAFHHTDPTPYLRTCPQADTNGASFTGYHYSFDNYPGACGFPCKFGWDSDSGFPFRFETVEGFDTDNDGFGDLTEINPSVPGSVGGTDPQVATDPIRNRAALFSRASQDFLRQRDPVAAAIPNMLTHFTVEAWIAPTDLGAGVDQVIVDKAHVVADMFSNRMTRSNFRLGIDASRRPFVMYHGHGGPSLSFFAVATNAIPATSNGWTHLAGTCDGTNLVLYVNAVMAGRNGNLTQVPVNGYDLDAENFARPGSTTVGARDGVEVTLPVLGATLTANLPLFWYSEIFPGTLSLGMTDYYGGYVDEVRVWNGARTQTAIRDNMRKKLSPTESDSTASLQHYYPFDDCPDVNINWVGGTSEPAVPGNLQWFQGANEPLHSSIYPWLVLLQHSTVYTGTLAHPYNYLVYANDVSAHRPIVPPTDDLYHEWSNGVYSLPTNYINNANPYESRTDVRYIIDQPVVDLLFFNGAQADGDVFTNVSWMTGNPMANPDATDTDNDGLPDWWEILHGFDPNDAGGVNGASGDIDGDGLTNLSEYQAGTDPNCGTCGDALKDSDLDGLSNIDEQDMYFTNPGNPDTDDDTFLDGAEVTNSTSALYSRSPLVPRSMVMNGTAVTVPEPKVLNTDLGVYMQTFEDLQRWVVACRVMPAASETGSLIIRQIEETGQTNFDLRLDANVPQITFTAPNGTRYSAVGPTNLVAGQFSTLLAQWSPTNGLLTLSVNECVVAAQNVSGVCSTGPGVTRIGAGVNGHIDDVYIGEDVMTGEAQTTPDFVLILDVSGSMDGQPLSEEKNAANTAIDAIPASSSIAIISFADTAVITQNFTTDKTLLKSKVNALQASGATSYQQAIQVMLQLFAGRPANRQRVAIFISDGQPNMGTPTDAELLQASNAGIVINTIAFGYAIQGFTYELERMSTATGGTFLMAPTGDLLKNTILGLIVTQVAPPSGFYLFDDGGTTAEDFSHPRDLSYALRGVTFDAAVYSTEVIAYNRLFYDTETLIPTWWKSWFFPSGTGLENLADPDGDGLPNIIEYQLGLNPVRTHTHGLTVTDYLEDTDGDTLPNGTEYDTYGSSGKYLDTDDDSRNDNEEVAIAADPADSSVPAVMRTLRFGSAGGNGLVTVSDKILGLDTERFSQTNWTVECMVRVRTNLLSGVEMPLVRRGLRCSDFANFEMGIKGVSSAGVTGLVPYAAFVDEGGSNRIEVVGGGVSVPQNTWQHFASTFGNGVLTLYIDGVQVASGLTGFKPVRGPGDLIIGNAGFAGDIKEIRVWKMARKAADIDAFSRRTILFDRSAADPGLLRVNGAGDMRENATVIDPTDGGFIDDLELWTLEGWVKTRGAGMLISRSNLSDPSYTDANYLLAIGGDGKLYGRFATAYQFVTTTVTSNGTTTTVDNHIDYNQIHGALPVNDGQWHHVAFVRNETNCVLYIDGVLDASQNSFLVPIPGQNQIIQNAVIRSLRGPVIIGADLTGDIDEVRIWKRGLSPQEINKVRMTNLRGNEEGLISYFNFDYQSGTNAEDRADVRDPETEYGRYIPNATLVRTSDGPPISIKPLNVYRSRYLTGYFPTDDGGLTVEDFVQQGDTNYAGIMSGDVIFTVLAPADSPFSGDSDNDGLPDWWETIHGLNPGSNIGLDGEWGDPDHDGLNNRAEFLAGTDPWNFDTFGTGYSDYDSRTNAGSLTFGELYSDGDGMDDSWEILYSVLSPLLYDGQGDPDADGWSNFAEFMYTGKTTNGVEVRSTNPMDMNSHPTPGISFIFKNIGLSNAGPIRVQAYHAATMDGTPDAAVSITVSNGLFPYSTTVRQWDQGWLREGQTWFFAFQDRNGDGTWSPGEAAGLPEVYPLSVGWGDVTNVVVGLVESLTGYQRFSWAASPGAAGYYVSIRNISVPGFPTNIDRYIAAPRTYFHEGDYRNAGYFGMDNGGYPNAGYEYFVRLNSFTDGTSYATAKLTNRYAALQTPVLYWPVGAALQFAANEFVWSNSVNATRFRLQFSTNSAFDTPVYDATSVVPFQDADGLRRYRLPIFLGDVLKNNTTYYWRVQAVNPVSNSAFSAAAAFVVNLQESPSGAYTISGEASYFGKILFTNAVRAVVQAFVSPGFNGVPDAQVTLTNKGSFTLMGLRANTYYVRAFIDQNNNRQLSPFESWGFVKNTTPYETDYQPKPLVVPGNLVGQKVVMRDRDTDNDSLPDGWEYQYVGNLTTMSAISDTDMDGLLDVQEYAIDALDTDPTKWDTDGDGISDYNEVWWNGSGDYDPYDPITNPTGTDLNPHKRSTDNSGVSDGTQDADSDALSNALEFMMGTDPHVFTTLFGLTSVTAGTTADVVRFNIQGGVTNVITSFTVKPMWATNLLSVWQPVPSGNKTVNSGNWKSGPWVKTNSHALGSTLFYRVDWTSP